MDATTTRQDGRSYIDEPDVESSAEPVVPSPSSSSGSSVEEDSEEGAPVWDGPGEEDEDLHQHDLSDVEDETWDVEDEDWELADGGEHDSMLDLMQISQNTTIACGSIMPQYRPASESHRCLRGTLILLLLRLGKSSTRQSSREV